MNETAPIAKDAYSDNPGFPLWDMVVNNDNLSQYRDDTGRIEEAVSKLEAAGAYIDEHIAGSWKDKVLLDALEARGVDIVEAIASTSVFNRAAPSLFQETVDLPDGYGVNRDGSPRRAESGGRLNFELLREFDIDPTKVLFFRVTQPSTEPVPELYWTTDFREVRGGLGVELGRQRDTSVILIDTLDSIAGNGGLMRDVNDDSGVAVRQLGLDGYSQAGAIGVIPGRL